MVDRVGQQLGKYRLVRLLGRGGFAEVYLGEHVRLGTVAAVKVLLTRLATNDEIESFEKEARSIAHLIHPHIVRVFDFDVIDDTPFLIMDYAAGGTLRQRHPKGTILPLPTIISYAKQIANALQYAHEKKLIHRDIKPENILLGENQQILLSDFGIALIAQSTRYQNTQEVIGTAAYMAPEQLQGKPRRASDQYSLGIVVYEWLCGNRPFHGSFTEIYSQHMFVPPPSLCEKLPELPPAVEEVVSIALAKDPKERFATIQAFAAALEQACQTTPSRPIALLPEFPSPSQPLPPTDTVVASPSRQLSGSPNAASFSASNISDYENTPPVLEPKSHAVLGSRRQDLRPGKIVLLIGLALLVLIGSLGLFNIMRINQIARDNAYATAIAQTNSTDTAITAQANAAATATVRYNDYVRATSGNPVLDDPLDNNSKGNGWAEGNESCVFSGGAYHVKISQTGYFEACFARPTFSNFAFQVQMTILNGDYGGIVFRTSQGHVFGYRFAFGSGSDNLVYDHELAKFTNIKADLNRAYLLTAIARGSSISLYIDKQWVATAEDSSASSGGIGLMAGDFSNAADVAFRNAQVWNL